MNRLFFTITLIIVLTACTPNAPVVPTVKDVFPTETPVPTSEPTSTLTKIPTSTSIPEPTATPEPTKIPMPEGWTAISETREIGGWQVVLNEKGEAATQITGEWYPVDSKGCFYKELYDPEIQKQDPKILELVEKINNAEPFFSKDSGVFSRHFSGSLIARVRKDRYPVMNESIVDAMLTDQNLCFDNVEWKHVIDFVTPVDVALMPDETILSRAVVGWIRNDEYVSFTYQQESERGEGSIRKLTGTGNEKAKSIDQAFRLWQSQVDSNEQIALGLPSLIFLGVDGENLTDDVFETSLRRIVKEAPNQNSDLWSSNLRDPEFIRWALTENNQMKFAGNKKWNTDWRITHKNTMWRYRGELIVDGKGPELVVRVAWIPRKW